MPRRAHPIVRAWLGSLVLAACSAGAPPAKVALGPPTTPLPPIVAELGSPCVHDTTTRSPGQIRMREIDTTCGPGGRASIVELADYVTITGKHFVPGYDLDDDPRFHGTFQGPIVYPPGVLRVITLARSRRGQDVIEVTVYADGWRLWIKGVDEVGQQFPTAGLLIADRRYLTAADVDRIHDRMGLSRDVPLDDDQALRRALGKLPSLPPGKDGELR
jgi:hypothetical protein